jgi:hypothetical protein
VPVAGVAGDHAAAVSVLTLVGTLVAQYFESEQPAGTPGTLKGQRERLDMTRAE